MLKTCFLKINFIPLNKMINLTYIDMFRDFKKYEVFDDGRIWSYKTNRWLKPGSKKNGYLVVVLSDNNNIHKTYQLHRVVYEACSQAPIPEGLDVNHINEDKSDNRFENLNLMTRKENVNWGTAIERKAKAQINHPLKSKQVEQYDKNGNLLNVWPSIIEIERQLGYSNGHISECCRGKLKTYKGFIWRYTS